MYFPLFSLSVKSPNNGRIAGAPIDLKMKYIKENKRSSIIIMFLSLVCNKMKGVDANSNADIPLKNNVTDIVEAEPHLEMKNFEKITAIEPI